MTLENKEMPADCYFCFRTEKGNFYQTRVF